MNALFLLFFGLLATLVLETAVFLPLFCRKDGLFIGAFYCVNAATNVTLNVILSLVMWLAEACGTDLRYEAPAAYLFGCFTVLLECAVVWVEYAVLKKFHPYKNLLAFVAGANALSAVAGSALVAFVLSVF